MYNFYLVIEKKNEQAKYEKQRGEEENVFGKETGSLLNALTAPK